MITYYTAVGRFEKRNNNNKEQFPVVIVNHQEYMVSIPEMIIWTMCNWRFLKCSQIQKIFGDKLQQCNINEYTSCKEYIDRLILRGLIVAGIGDSDSDALYDLICRLYVIPINSSLHTKIIAFFKFTLRDGISIFKAFSIFKKQQLSGEEKRVLNLAKQAKLSTAELIKCIEYNIYDVSNDEKIMTQLYNDDVTTNDNICYSAELYSQQRPVLITISNLYLRREIIFERI